MHGFWLISSNIDEIFTINPSANVLFLGDFHIYHKDWHILVELILLMNSVIIFLSQITQMINFPTQIPDYNSPALLYFFLSSDFF